MKVFLYQNKLKENEACLGGRSKYLLLTERPGRGGKVFMSPKSIITERV